MNRKRRVEKSKKEKQYINKTECTRGYYVELKRIKYEEKT